MPYLVPREPFNITGLRRQMDDLFDHFFPLSTALSVGNDPAAEVSVDVIDNQESYLVKANIPGVAAKDLDVRVTEEHVVIGGSYSEEKEEKEDTYLLRERRSGSFTRVLPFRESINPDKAKARFKDGVLELTLPKADKNKKQGRQLHIEG
ncbi:MAG: Hsp20/alpha crystallin family protein [Bacillota bacterium]|nr:Hsp20/alpha crystallin family protein [Bacillota bacterium]MDW7683625.1 Hsp20/alpha crystallin family protein [Bacillota bacterium]